MALWITLLHWFWEATWRIEIEREEDAAIGSEKQTCLVFTLILICLRIFHRKFWNPCVGSSRAIRHK